MGKVKVKFRNRLAEEVVTIEIHTDCGKTQEEQIEEEFYKWLNNKERSGWSYYL